MEAMPAPDHLLSPRIVRVGLAVVVLTTSASMAATQDGECREPQACSERALEARERGAYETFHDLAWRAVQTSRPDDPAVLYLLARAQALSGRRRDAAITLRRLAEAGVPNDAATHEDFRRVRELPEWPYIQTLAARLRPSEPERNTVVAAAPPAAPDVAVAPSTPSVGVEKPPPPAIAVAKAPPPAVKAAKPPMPAALPPARTVRASL